EITARMEAVPAPVRCREEWHGDFLQIGRALAVIVVIERVHECAGDDVAPIRFQLFWRQRLGPGNRLAGDAAARAARPDAMLHRNNRTRIPVRNEFGIDASMITGFAVMIRRALPSTEGRQVRWRQCSDLPCVHRKIGNTVEADLAGTPLLRRGPFDAFVKVSGFARRPRIDITRRAAGAARIDTHDCIAVRYPLLRVNDFPVLIFIARSYGDFWLLLDHPLPGEIPPILEGVAFRIGPVIEDRRKFAVAHGAEYIGAQDDAVTVGIAASHSICMPSGISDPAALISRGLSCCVQAKAPLAHPLRQSREEAT